MKLLVGLGNPGKQYELTRHNAGFLMMDRLMEDLGGTWDTALKFSGQFGRVNFEDESFYSVKPLTYMNRSSQCVSQVASFFKIPQEHVIVIFDDMDVPQGKVRALFGGGHGGHNGIRSLIDQGGMRDFHRIKLGLGRPPEHLNPADWLLSALTPEELELIKGPMVDDVKLRIKQILDQLRKKV